ncbi:FecR protein [Dyadobacter jejuensis]|uniref:FecR protein n=1 Tax=Dyadobacter jejuensis TaxID=1082580 RepID=A0A316AJQ7_9BACT|nr:FecR domain-containing protein [Dyadobacter jejuensis]PWJ57578.1 FecR protein [Dyadobacter jejuensis]
MKANEDWQILLRFFKTGIRPTTFSASDKDMLWEEIVESLESQNRTRYRFRWGLAAASVLVFLFAGMYFLSLPSNELGTMKRLAAEMVADTGRSALILSDSRVVTLEDQHSEIVHKDDKSIGINDSEIVMTPKVGLGYNKLIVPYGKRSVITLEDGTKIWLNSGSKLVYPVRFEEDHREVYLEGQAYFEVSHRESQPFYVQTKDLKVKVLGTGFDVSAYADDALTQTTLVHGSIEVSLQSIDLLRQNTRKLTPGTQLRYNVNSQKINHYTVNVAEYVSWKDGYLILHQAPLQEILKKLNRYYKLPIELNDPKLAKETFSGTLDLADTVEQALGAISVTTGMSYHLTERGYLIER